MVPRNACVFIVIGCFISIVGAQIYDFGQPEEYNEPGHGSNKKLYKLGEFNDKCRSTRDCRHFGYVCRDNRTCQCDFLYIPDSERKTCVGGVNQRCIYDEHCIEGAFCMNQAICKCKDNNPIELEDGLVCAGCASILPCFLLLLISLFAL
ncbi:PREDICTED: uncharacterized protein LOC108562414 [Nicrophorus vespilloides]|uniref:Uncharacterized protein LOC108562414 n=1 Tax=Nicrophorus vespilloides TaxID=110193 RepID=A0ABM1MNW1_NICVS|nr:PREDICTED: uncharacterized protein LOC108562414 [Nicrophorus vespilloides]